MGINKSDQNGNQTQHGQLIVKEWIYIKRPDLSTDSHVVEWFSDGTQPKITKRYPWEGFYDVGFRTILDVPGGDPTK